MYLRRLIYSNIGKYIISILLGLGLSTLFRKVCNERNCMVFKASKRQGSVDNDSVSLDEKSIFECVLIVT